MDIQSKVYRNYNRYLIRSDGSIYDLVKKEEKVQRVRDGYAVVDLYDNQGRKNHFKTHQIIARLFVANPYNYKEINHKDGTRNNSHYSNLEWVTHSQNIKHAWETGLIKSTKERSQKISKANKGRNTSKDNHKAIKIFCITTNEIFDSMADAVRKYGISQAQLSKCCSRKNGVKSAGKHPATKEPLKWRIA